MIKTETDPRQWNGIRRRVIRDRTLYALLLIPVAYILIFAYYPMYGAQIAFRDFKVARGILGSPWVGLKHFHNFLANYMFVRLLRNTLSISLYALATFPVSVVLALLLHNMPLGALKKSVQMISYAPHFISTVVMCGMILQFLSVRSGMVNHLLRGLGFQAVDFLGQAAYFPSVYVWTGVWQNMGYGSIIYLSALSGVDPELHESARIDGASLVQRILHVDLPTILPTIMIMFILNCGHVLSVGYEKIYLLQNTLNISTSEVISTYVYKQGLASAVPQYSYSTAVGLFVSAVNLVMLALVNGMSKRLSKTSLW